MSSSRERLPWAYLAAGCVATAVYFLLPSVASQDVWYDGVGLSAVVAILVGVRVHRPQRPLPWLLIAAGQFLWIIGDTTWNYYEIVLHRAVPYPAAPDAFYLAGYPLVAAGLVLFIRSRSPGRDRASLVDASIVTTGLGLLVWIYLAAPYARDASLGTAGRLVSVAYPLVDVLLIAVAARLLIGPSRRERTQYLLLGFLIAILTSDVVYSLLALFGTYHTGDLVDAGWLLGYVLVGAAGLHPSMAGLSRPHAAPDARIRRRRLALLAGASLIAPAVLAIEWARRSPLDVPVVAVCAAVLFLLVVVRMSGLVRDIASKADMLSAQGSELEQALAQLQDVETERRRLLEETMRTGERERSRIAAELHDGSIQHLASLGYTLHRVGMRLHEGEREVAMELLEKAEETLGAEVSSLRAMMRGLRPPALDETGLVEAIRDHVAVFCDREHVECQVHLEPVPRLEPEVETALYRVAQEALRNVGRHAAATAVTVRLERRADAVQLEIADNGSGFAKDRVAGAVQRGHFGLAGMRERLEMAGGELEIESGLGAGTVVRAIVPLAMPGTEPTRADEAPTAAPEGLSAARSEIGSFR